MQTWKAVLSSVMIGAFGAAAVAQDAPAKGQPPAGERPGRGGGEGQPRGGGGGRQQLSPEKAKAAWEVQAKGVAKRLGLNDAQTTALVKAYGDARTSQNEAFEKARKEMQEKAKDSGDDNGGGRQRMGPEVMAKLDEVNSAERSKFEKSLTSSGLSAEQASKSVASLGTFNRQWDTMADAVHGFGLEAGKQQEALNAIEEYVVAASKARASAAGDPEAVRTTMREAREKLTATMKKTLSEEQFGKFEASMGPGGRGQGRPPGGGEGEAPRPRRNREGGGEGGGGGK